MTRSNNRSHDPPPEVLFSENALHRAWRLVRRNGNSPGIDGVTIKHFASHLDRELKQLQRDVFTGNYHPQRVKRFYVEKASGKNRPLSLWAVRDRVAQRVIHDYLTPILERMFLPCSYGFRPERSTNDAIKAVQHAYQTKRRWVVDADIQSCFDSIPIGLLMKQVQRIVPSRLAVKMIEQWLVTPVHGQFGEMAGVSQGSVISPQLANLYLHRFDQMVFSALPGIFLVRFADDFVILCRQREEAEWALVVAGRSLANLKLQLNHDKTQVVHFQEGFIFLGMRFKGKRLIPQSHNEGGG